MVAQDFHVVVDRVKKSQRCDMAGDFQEYLVTIWYLRITGDETSNFIWKI
jgi:hypothetical protein